MKVNAILGYNADLNYNTSVKSEQNRGQFINPVTFRGKNKVDLKKLDVIDIFKNLAKIPSPPLKEQKVAKWILKYCKANKIGAELDNYGNVKVNIPATDKKKKPLLFSAHMDVVGDNSPVNLITDDKFIKTDENRTLGADDKAGIAAALRLARDIVKEKFKHGGAEMLFTRDEEQGFTGIKNVDFKAIRSKYALVLDEAKLGKFDKSGASYTTGYLSVETTKGGHSALDIEDKTRINATNAICNLIAKFPQGMYRKNKNGTFTSINMGPVKAGEIIGESESKEDIIKNAVTNVINRKAQSAFSIRSTNKKQEKRLEKRLKKIVDKFNDKNKDCAKAELYFKELMPEYKVKDSKMEKIYRDACDSLDMEANVGRFAGCAETHIIANKTNKDNEKMIPILLGVADIENMHASSEKMDMNSLKKGYELLKKMFLLFNS